MKKRPGFSVVHLNSRSLLANIDKIEMCVEKNSSIKGIIRHVAKDAVY